MDNAITLCQDASAGASRSVPATLVQIAL